MQLTELKYHLRNFFVSWSFRVRAFIGRNPVNWQKAIESLHWLNKEELLRTDTLSMIERIYDISETRVKDIMIPRTNMKFIDHSADLNQIVKMITKSGHSRFPVIDDNLDHIVGILLAKDLLQYLGSETQETFNIKNHIRQAVIVPQSKRINVLLGEFRKSRNHIAIVVDEYGGTCGLVTIEDVLEQIVGEISDEYDMTAENYIHLNSKGDYVIKALTPLENFNLFFKTNLASKSVETIGGLVIESLGKMPEKDEKVTLEDITFKVYQSDRRRIHSLIVRRVT